MTYEPTLGTALRELADACPGWVTGEGAAWPWCDRCGLRADRHPGSPLAETVSRIVNRVRT